MQVAYQLLSGDKVERYNPYYLGVYATNTEHEIDVPYAGIKTGENAFPDLPGGMTPVVNITNSPPNVPIWVQITLEDLQNVGK
jgi:hypothetical protein